MSERYVSVLRKAWVDPQGNLHEFFSQHHMQWLQSNAPEVPYHESMRRGWIRLTRRGLALDVEGLPGYIERSKMEILMWAGPHVSWVNIDPSPMGRAFESSPEAFEEQSVEQMLIRSRMLGGTIFRRRPIHVRRYRRRR